MLSFPVGCSHELEKQVPHNEHVSQTVPINAVPVQNSLDETEVLAIMTGLIEKANHANYIASVICETDITMSEISGNTGNRMLRPYIEAENITDLEEYFYSVFETETAQKYLYPITNGITVNERTLPLYYDSENGLTLEYRALADPLFLGEWRTDSLDIISIEENTICASAEYSLCIHPTMCIPECYMQYMMKQVNPGN